MSGAFPELDANRRRFESWARSRDLNLEPILYDGQLVGYVVPYVDAIYNGFLAGLSCLDFGDATGLKAVPNAGFKL